MHAVCDALVASCATVHQAFMKHNGCPTLNVQAKQHNYILALNECTIAMVTV